MPPPSKVAPERVGRPGPDVQHDTLRQPAPPARVLSPYHRSRRRSTGDGPAGRQRTGLPRPGRGRVARPQEQRGGRLRVVEHRDVPAPSSVTQRVWSGSLSRGGPRRQQHPVPRPERDGHRHGDRRAVARTAPSPSAQGLPETGRGGHVVDGSARLVRQLERVAGGLIERSPGTAGSSGRSGDPPDDLGMSRTCRIAPRMWRGADLRHSPAGSSAVTVRARPIRPSSRATQPPLLFPATCAVGQAELVEQLATATPGRAERSRCPSAGGATRRGRAGPPRSRRARRRARDDGVPASPGNPWPCRSTSGSPCPVRSKASREAREVVCDWLRSRFVDDVMRPVHPSVSKPAKGICAGVSRVTEDLPSVRCPTQTVTFVIPGVIPWADGAGWRALLRGNSRGRAPAGVESARREHLDVVFTRRRSRPPTPPGGSPAGDGSADMPSGFGHPYPPRRIHPGRSFMSWNMPVHVGHGIGEREIRLEGVRTREAAQNALDGTHGRPALDGRAGLPRAPGDARPPARRPADRRAAAALSQDGRPGPPSMLRA